MNCHEFEYELVGERYFPTKTMFLKRTKYITKKCCGKNILRYQLILIYKCKKCGEIKTLIHNPYMGKCPVCNHIYDYSDHSCPS